MMPAQVATMKHEAGVLMGITDTACARTVAGTHWLQDYLPKTCDLSPACNTWSMQLPLQAVSPQPFTACTTRRRYPPPEFRNILVQPKLCRESFFT